MKTNKCLMNASFSGKGKRIMNGMHKMKNDKNLSLIPLAAFLLLTIVISMSTVSAATDTKTITDMAGNTVVIPAEITKVITYNAVPPLNSFIMALGKGDTIINGIPQSMASMPQAKYQTILVPKIANQPDVGATGSAINVEQIVSMKPDVVIATEKSTVDALKSSGIPVVYLQFTDTDMIKKSMTILGQIFDNPSKASEYNTYFDDKLAKIDSIVSTIPEDQKPKVLNMWAPTMAVFNASYWIVPAGGIDAFDPTNIKGGYGGVAQRYQGNMEELQKWNPDIIVVRDANDTPYLESNAQFSNIDAVKNQKIYVAPAGTFTWNGAVETPLMFEWAATKLHPEKFKESDLIADTKNFYNEFFGYKLTDQQAQDMINGDQ